MKDTTVNTDAETFQVAFKNAPIGMAIVDLDGRWLSVNQALCDIVGYTKEEFLSSDFRSITHPDDLDADLALLKQLYKNEIPSYEMEKRYFHKDGSIVWAHLTVGTVRDDNGTPKYYISQILDVSDRKIGEQSLKDQKNLLELAERTAHLGHWSYDLKTEELFWSDEVFRIHGLNKEEYTPEVESAIGFYHPDDREDVERMFNAAIEKQKPFNFDFRLIHQLGRVIYVQTSGRPEMNYKGEVVSVFGVFQDISERKAAEQSLLRANKELETFAYVASHDLRAPLRGVDNLAQWIEEDLQDKMSDEGRECMRLLRQRVSRLEMMLQDILSYSRVGRVEEDPEVLDLNELLKDLVDTLDIQDGFEVKIPDDIPEIFSSYTSVQQVFSNLIINALKHHDQNKGCVEVEWGKMGDMMHFTVRDDGAGIEKEHQDRVFEMFQTLNARDKVEGSGLGLSIIKKLVEGQGGQIWIETEDKKRGTAMHFTWPKTYQENAI